MVNTPKITIDVVSWQSGQAVLEKLKPLISYQFHTPAVQSFDVHDYKANHFIAYDQHSQPIGCIRLLEDGKISKPQVTLEWLNKSIENLLIEAIIQHAKKDTELEQISILEDARIAPFYVHFGFKAEGLPITDKGLPAQLMIYQIKRKQKTTENNINEPLSTSNSNALGVSIAETKSGSDKQFNNLETYLDALKTVASGASRIIKIYSPLLPPQAFGNPKFLEILSAHCRRSRYTEVQVLIISSKSLVSGAHGLRALYEKLPSSISIRRFVPADDEIDYREYLISDDGHMSIRSRDRTLSLIHI